MTKCLYSKGELLYLVSYGKLQVYLGYFFKFRTLEVFDQLGV